jgi:hypothetical protein
MAVRDRKSGKYLKLMTLTRRVGAELTTGIHAAEGATAYPAGTTVAEIASAHEFGLGVPERSFVRAWFDENENKLSKAIKLELNAAMKRGKLKNAFKSLAVTIQGSIQQRIANGIDPELDESTILRKGSSTPLIDTETLRSSIITRSSTGAEVR